MDIDLEAERVFARDFIKPTLAVTSVPPEFPT